MLIFAYTLAVRDIFLAMRASMSYNAPVMRRCDGIGRRAGLKIPWWQHRIGSTPIAGTIKSMLQTCSEAFFYC